MWLVQAKQLEGDGIRYKSAQNIYFEGNSFVRGIAFSNRLRHLADDIYRAEVKSGNACLIVEDEIHFTIWRQESTLESMPTPQAKPAPSRSTIERFVQNLASAKQVTLPQPTLTSAKISQQQSPGGGGPIITQKRLD